jgi:hypothetical protein
MEYKVSNSSSEYKSPTVKNLRIQNFDGPSIAGFLLTPYEIPQFFTMFMLAENEHN